MSKVQKERVVTWSKTDKAGNETAFASIDMRAPAAEGPKHRDFCASFRDQRCNCNPHIQLSGGEDWEPMGIGFRGGDDD